MTKSFSDIEKNQLQQMLRVMKDACGKQISPSLIQFVETEMLKHDFALIKKAIAHFTSKGEWPTVANLVDKISEYEPPKFGMGTQPTPQSYEPTLCLKDLPEWGTHIVVVEMERNSNTFLADNFFSQAKRKIESQGFEVVGRQRYQGNVSRDRENWFQIKEHFEVMKKRA